MKQLLSKILISVLTLSILLPFASTPAHAAASLYITPGSSTIAQNSSFSVSVRVNTGGAKVNAVQANLSYPADKLELQGFGSAGGAFEIKGEENGGGGNIKIGRGSVDSVTGDQLVATITFKAKVKSGSATVSFSSGTAVVRTSDTKNIVSGKSGGTYSFTKPVPKPKPDTAAPKISAVKVSAIGTETATISWKTNEKATSVVEYGPSKKLGITASSKKLVTAHKVKLSSQLLTSGTQFFYVVKSKDAAGNEGKSKLTSFRTKGYQIKITVLNQSGSTIQIATVTLIPSLLKSETNESGVVNFKDIAAGQYAVQVEIDNKKYSEVIEVKEDKDIGKVQNFTVKIAVETVSGFEKYALFGMIFLGLIAVVLALGFFWMRRNRKSEGRDDNSRKWFDKDIHFVKFDKSYLSKKKSASQKISQDETASKPKKPTQAEAPSKPMKSEVSLKKKDSTSPSPKPPGQTLMPRGERDLSIKKPDEGSDTK